MRRLFRPLLLGLLAVLPLAGGVHAQTEPRRMELQFTPTNRAQIAIWVESADGELMGTVRLTEAVAYRGIGNRPGANQMNTGFRYPYGRREGVLPVWAHRRMAATGEGFPRVFFWGRQSSDDIHSGEGYASIASDPSGSNTVDNHFCLSFTDSANALDAVTCASVFRSNKGRYVAPQDVDSGYAAEPWQNPAGEKSWRPLSTESPYPPRRDVNDTATSSDHPDVMSYAEDARAVMPDIDAVTMATLPGAEPHTVRFTVPEGWPDGDYVAYLEIHVEADFNEFFNPDIYGPPAPEPQTGDAYWDYWAHTKGMPGRGQPSVVYRVPFTLSPSGGAWFGTDPVGFGELHGLGGQMTPMPSAQITDDPSTAPGSGADRLMMRNDGTRLTVLVKATDVCRGTDPHPLCGQPCTGPAQCPDPLVDCGPTNVCIDYCDSAFGAPPAVEDFLVEPVEDDKHSHEWARVRFTEPVTDRPAVSYDVRYMSAAEPPPTDPLEREQWFTQLLQIKKPQLESEALEIPPTTPGTTVSEVVGQLDLQTRHQFAMRVVDVCGRRGPITTGEVTTTEIHFETVSPCFVATAAYGTPLADDIGVLRRFRDRYLASHAPGRALVAAYYALGPAAAEVIEANPTLRKAARVALSPAVRVAGWLNDWNWGP